MRNTLIFVILLLILANFVYRWPTQKSEVISHRSSQLSIEKLDRLKEIGSLKLISMSNDTVVRDIFSPVKKNTRSIPQKPVYNPKPHKQDDLIQENEVIGTVDHMNEYKLIGVLIRNGEKYAYILDGLNTYVSKSGDTLTDNVYVSHVTQSHVTITNTKTGTTKQLAITGG